MYSTCLFCARPLGANEAVELFPVGRRLAFDAAKGRLWVVCRSCERWNLSPIEERWEVIDTCERMFSETRTRVSTENIGLAKLREGLELVRIGSPLRPEFAAWRYGDQFGRRRRRNAVRLGVGVAATGAVFAGAAATGMAMGSVFISWNSLRTFILASTGKRVVAHLSVGVHDINVQAMQLRAIVLEPHDRYSWVLQIPHKGNVVIATGDEAQRAVAKLLPAINKAGGNTNQVRQAVDLLEGYVDPLQFVAHTARTEPRKYAFGVVSRPPIAGLPAPVRLALEMATHEEAERRALEGELMTLESAWREAEEVAKISDELLVPEAVQHTLRALKTDPENRSRESIQ